MADNLLIGIDVGTTSVKAKLFDLTGRERSAYHAAYETMRSSSGHVDQDAELWFEHILRALTQFAGVAAPGQVKAIGITSQVNTHVFVADNGNAVAPAIVWQDGRCADEAEELSALVSTQDQTRWWGAPRPFDASHCLSRMQWMRKNRPEIWDKTRWVMLPKDYCILKLTGQVVSDPISNLGTVDKDLQPIAALLERVPGAGQRTVPLANMDDIAGSVRANLPFAGVPVCVGVMDAWAGLIGVGVHDHGQSFYLSGTSEILGHVSPDLEPTKGVIVFPAVEQMTVHAGPTQAGGASIQWYCSLFNTTPEAMANSVAVRNKDTSVPLFLPHLQGERAPLWDIHARGTFLGIDSTTGPAEFACSVYEGVGLSARLLQDALDTSAMMTPPSVNCGGGGFQSDVFNQIRADILGRNLKRTAVKDPGVLGAAALAAVATRQFDTLNQALSQIVSFDRTYQPDPDQHARYNHLYELYQETYYSTRTLNHRLSELHPRARS